MSYAVKEVARGLIAGLPADATIDHAIEVIARHTAELADARSGAIGGHGTISEPGSTYISGATEPSLLPGSVPFYGRDAADRVISALPSASSWADVLAALSARKAIDAGLVDMAGRRRYRHSEVRAMFGLPS